MYINKIGSGITYAMLPLLRSHQLVEQCIIETTLHKGEGVVDISPMSNRLGILIDVHRTDVSKDVGKRSGDKLSEGTTT